MGCVGAVGGGTVSVRESTCCCEAVIWSWLLRKLASSADVWA